MKYIRYFDQLNAFGYIERVIKSDFFSRKRLTFLHACAICSVLPSYINNLGYTVDSAEIKMMNIQKLSPQRPILSHNKHYSSHNTYCTHHCIRQIHTHSSMHGKNHTTNIIHRTIPTANILEITNGTFRRSHIEQIKHCSDNTLYRSHIVQITHCTNHTLK